MSHIAVRLVAAALGGVQQGGGFPPPPVISVNTVLALQDGHLDGQDELPPNLTIYDETHHGWVATSLAPSEEALDLEYPHLAVSLGDSLSLNGLATRHGDGVSRVENQLEVGIRLVQHANDMALASTREMYYRRAIRDFLLWFHHADNAGLRQNQATGIQIELAGDIRTARAVRPNDDDVSVLVFLVPYTVVEPVPFDAAP